MASIGRRWNGSVFGTNTGNVNITIDGEDDQLTAVIRLNDDRHGGVVYNASGTFSNGQLNLSGQVQPETNNPEQEFGVLTVAGILAPDGRVVGDWSTTIGTGGNFVLYPFGLPALPAAAGGIPEQLNTFQKSLGALRLFADDIPTLVAHVAKDFGQQRAVVTYVQHGNETTTFADNFIDALPHLVDVHYLKIAVSEQEQHGFNRMAQIEFTREGENIVRVQSSQESWAQGKASSLENHVKKYQRSVATQFRKFGLNVNVIIFGAALAALPELPGFGRRAAFIASVFVVQLGVALYHQRYVPNFTLFSKNRTESIFKRWWPSISSWSVTIIGGLIVAITYGALKGELKGSPISHFVQSVTGETEKQVMPVNPIKKSP
ncbi:hypothetical protein [Sphingorhabdus sp.]|jgi:hypothetical protein|uniref:hypothetical protein n=1 Tax=Sphingorhabdus sp. TaxID=1902408 RepID=UPI0037CAA3AB